MAVQFTTPTDIEQTEYVSPTGVTSVDVANMNAAIARIHAAGRGVIRLVETGQTLAINATIAFTHQTTAVTASLIGSNRSTITLSANAELVWGIYIHPDTTTTYSVPAGIGELDNSIVIPGTLPGGLEIDDCVLMVSDDSLNAKVEPHATTGKPGEIFRVCDVSGGQAYFDTPAIDAMTTPNSPRIIKIPASRRVRVENFELRGGSGVGSSGLNFYSCVDLRTENVKIFGGGQLSFGYCQNVRVSDCDIIRVAMPTPQTTYGIALAINSMVLIHNCQFGFARHCVTTGGVDSSTAGIRYGTGKGYVVSNCRASGLGEGATDGLVAFDAHSETYGMIFDNCQVYGGMTAGTLKMYGFSVRGRRSIIQNCYVRNDFINGGTGIAVAGPDTIVQNNYVEGGLLGVCSGAFRNNPTTRTDRTIIKGNVLRKQYRAAIELEGGRGHQVIGNLTPESGYAESFAKIRLLHGVGHLLGGTAIADRIVIRGNNLDLDGGGAFSIENLNEVAANNFQVQGNYMSGYGAGLTGISSHRRWIALTAYVLHDVVRVTSGQQLLISRTASGTSSSTQPTAAGVDGTVTWALFNWQAGGTYAVGNRVRITTNTAVLQCSAITTGIASGSQPVGAGVDGGVTWTLQSSSDDILHAAYAAKNYTD